MIGPLIILTNFDWSTVNKHSHLSVNKHFHLSLKAFNFNQSLYFDCILFIWMCEQCLMYTRAEKGARICLYLSTVSQLWEDFSCVRSSADLSRLWYVWIINQLLVKKNGFQTIVTLKYYFKSWQRFLKFKCNSKNKKQHKNGILWTKYEVQKFI